MEEKVGNLDTLKEYDVPVYCDDRIAFVDSLPQVAGIEPVKLDAFLMVVCLRGQAVVNINGRSFECRANDVLICHPSIILEKSMASWDIDFRCICLSKPYIQQLSLLSNGRTWDIVMFLEKSPVLPLTAEEVKNFCQYYDLIRGKLSGGPKPYQKKVVDALLQAFLYEFGGVLERFVKVEPQAYTAGNNVFRNFLELLSSTYPKPRSVSWYADKLCLSPKYLSTVCKEVSGTTASDLINRYVVKDVDFLLKQRGKSVKEICNELEFPNLSFFGRYVKKHLGASPKQYRAQVLGDED